MEEKKRKILLSGDRQTQKSPVLETALCKLKKELESRNFEVVCAPDPEQALLLASQDMGFDAFLISAGPEETRASAVSHLIGEIRKKRRKAPVFLLADRENITLRISEKLLKEADEFIWIFEDSPVFIAGRVESAADRAKEQLLPPLVKAICRYNERHHEYSYAAPGHQGGVGFTKSPEGKFFYDFYGENLFRTDTGIERTSIGSLLDHEGAFGKSEEYAARVFGSDHTFSGVVGTSGSNRSVIQACLKDGDAAVCDRNCHKSIEQGLILTGAVPVYMLPSRNCYGIIGPVMPQEMSEESLCGKLRKVLPEKAEERVPYSVLTNCTYDGICYNASCVEKILDPSVDRIHFDEAWYAYARFHGIYKDHFAMRGAPGKKKDAPTVFATHSTHKLLNALSQASYIHVREGRKPLDRDLFNQAYMMHATTSPLYAICASNDISSAMMDRCGKELLEDVIAEAVDFRQALARLCKEYTQKGSWFFRPWNPCEVTDPRTGKHFCFAEAPRELLIREQECWLLRKGESWHGFADLPDNWAMLDPIKVSILCPGMDEDGKISSPGVAAAVVSAFLYREGIVPTRTTDFQLMFLFSMGITKGKWTTLLNTLLRFRELYEKNAPVREVLPELAEKHPGEYASCGIRDLSEKMFRYLREENPDEALNGAFSSLPEMAVKPRDAYMKIVSGDVELVPSERLQNRISANSVIPYPPGIPMVMSGERFGGKDCPRIRYLHALEKWDSLFPGFEHETEGSKVIGGVYHVSCVRE